VSDPEDVLTQEFRTSILPRLTAADTALHNGDAAPRKALWAQTDPVTLFGAAMMTTGGPAIEPTFDWLASRFADCTAFDIEVVAAGASWNLAYLVALEHTSASLGGAAPASYSLRVTTICRSEAKGWQVVHHHADPVPDNASVRDRLVALGSVEAGAPPGPS
jgi:ketosteroid isomerase-like protein